jgi:hypothetical protein
MEAMPQRWTDDRMDDLSAKVDELGRRMENGFNRVDADIRALRDDTKTAFGSVRAEMREGFDRIDERFNRIDGRFDKVDERFERFEIRSDERFEAMMDRLYSMQRLMIQFCGVAMAALLAVLATLVGSLLT